VEKKFGGLDILISNAGINPSYGPILDVGYVISHIFLFYDMKSLVGFINLVRWHIV